MVVSRTLAHLGVAFVSGGLLQAYGRTISLSLYIFFHYHCPEICVYEREKEIVQYMDIHKNYKKQTLIRMNIHGHMYISDRRMRGVHEPVLTRKLLGSPNASSVIYATSRCRLGPGNSIKDRLLVFIRLLFFTNSILYSHAFSLTKLLLQSACMTSVVLLMRMEDKTFLCGF